MKKKLSLLMVALVAITAFAVQVSRRAATEVANIAALNVLENGAEFNFTGEALVVYQNGNYVYVKDDTGSTLIYKKDVVAANSIGKTIEANWTGKVNIFNKLFEVVPDAEKLTLKEGDPVTVTYPEATIADVTVANVNKIVKLTDVTIASVSGKDFKIKKGDVTVAGYNQFAVEGLASGLVCTEMVGAISVYNDAIQFQPISYTVGTPAPDPVDVVISPETGADISAALSDATATAPVKSVTINLAKDGAYTLTSTIKAPAVTINGNGATIDASAGDNIVGIEGVTEFAKKEDGTDSDHSFVKAVTFKDVTITGMKKALIRDLMTKTLLETLTIENCVMQASDGKPFIDFDGRGYVGKVVVKNSTIWAAAGTNKNFAKYGSRPKNVNEALTQEFDIQNSTIVNIAPKADFSGGQNFNNLKQNGTAQNVYTVKNNIFVNCGKSGQVIVGLNNGQTSATPVWDVDGNAFNWNDADVSATEVSKAGKHKVGEEDVDIVQNSVEGVVAFKDAANGDFTLGDCAQYTKGTGDPRWIVKVAKDITIAPESGDIATALAAAEAELAYNEVVGKITIILADNGTYTVSAPIVAPSDLYISLPIGSEGVATIDASGNEGDFITLNGSTTFAKKADGADSDHYLIDMVGIAGVKITGLKGALITDAQKTLVNGVAIANSVIEMPAAGKNVLNFSGKGYVGKVKVLNSTIYAKDKNTGFFAQYGSRPKNIDGDWLQEFDVQNSTIVNIANGKNFCDLKQSGTAQNVYTLKNNIFVDCGKSGQVVVGFNKGQTSATPVWNVDGNIFNAGGEDKSTAEVEKAGKVGEEDIVKNSVAGVVTFANAAEGDFNAQLGVALAPTEPTVAVGDPRWTVTAVQVPVDIVISPADGDIAAALTAATEGKLVKNITINLTKDVTYTLGASIIAPNSLVINGNGATIDASSLTSPFVALAAEPTASFLPKNDGSGNSEYYGVEKVSISGVKVTGLKQSIFWDSNVKYCVVDFKIENSVFALATEAVSNEALIAFQAGGAKDFTVKNSTIYGNNAVAKYFLRYNNSSRIDRYGFVGADDTWSFTYENNTFYGLLKSDGQWGNYNGVSQKAGQLVLTVKNNIWVDCDAQTMRRLNQSKNFSNFNAASSMANNIFNREGAVVDQGNYGNGSDLKGTVVFTDAAAGNFNADVTVFGSTELPAVGDPRWTVTYERAGITLWSSEEPATIVWDQQNIAIPAEKFANAKVGDVIRVVLQDVPTAATNIWDAQVELRGQNWKALEASLLVAGTATEAAKTVAEFVLTGDILAIAKEMGVQFNGANCKTSLIMLDYAEEVAGSDASVWVGSATKSNVSINKAHFANFNNFTGIKVGDKIRVTVKKTDAEKDCWIGMNYNNTSWQWSDFAEGSFVATSTETADGVITEFEVETEDAAKIMNEDNVAVFVNNPNQTVTQVELIAAPEAPKFYIIGLNGTWDRTNMIEMTRNESGRYEYEFTTETQAFFAFADKQMTAEEAEADSDWSVFNSFRYSLGDGDVEYTQLGEIKSLVKGAANGTITLKPGTFKITVEPDFNAVTITGEFAPEPQPVTVDKLFIMGTGTPKGWEGTTELTFNEATQAFEYEATVTEDTYLTFGDAEFTSWADFNGKHRFAPAEGNTDAVLDQAVQLVLVNDGCVVLKNAGTYKISVTKDLKMTITAGGTGINSIAADKMKNATIYTVSGQRVEKAQKGLYIINGRKVVIK